MKPTASTPAPSPPLASIALISAAGLGYEILLMRLFSIVQWHHFAYMIISLALLGFGASGTFLSLVGDRLCRRFEAAYVANASLFGLSAIGCFLLAQEVPFNALEILWDKYQPGWLLLMYLLLMVPFFFAANSVALAFMRFRGQIPRIYSFDLVGAGVGSLGIVLLLFVVSPEKALQVVGATGVASATLAWITCRARPRWVAVPLLALAGSVLFAIPGSWMALKMSEYKGLSQALQISGAATVDTRSSPLGQVTVVQSPKVPFRHAPGLSLNATTEPPEQVALFIDGEGMSVITRFDGRSESLTYLDDMTSALPYHLLSPKPTVLVLGAGGGAEVLQALHHGAGEVDAVELNPQIVDLVREDYKTFSGELYGSEEHSDRPQVHVAEARGFVAGSEKRYDLIQVALLDSFNASAAGLYALSESHLYTVEAIEEYLRHLKPDGLLALTRWIKLPPRDGIKLFATVVVALERAGVRDPGSQLGWIRSWNTGTLLIKNGVWTAADTVALRNFCDSRSFDRIYYPGMRHEEANRFNRLDQAYFFEAASALLGPARTEFLNRYKFQVAPATDDRPYYFNFFKWKTLPEILNLRERGGVVLLELGYPILIATLVQAIVASLILILLPLGLGRGGTVSSAGARVRRLSIFVYFSTIGLAFLFLEIAFIQKFILFLSHPLYAVAVVLASFLVFAGLGSRFSERGGRQGGAGTRVLAPIAGIVTLGALYLWVLPALFRWLMPWPDPLKVLISLLLIAPLAFCMGMPFPRGLARLGALADELIPWAWGINGCASVISAVLATILAIHFGFTTVVLLALCLYILAGTFGPRTFAARRAG